MKKTKCIFILSMLIILSTGIKGLARDDFRYRYNILKKENADLSHLKNKLSSSYLNYVGDFSDLELSEEFMPLDHQKYLYDMARERNLNYIKTLAILKHESQFESDSISSTKDYGYMQINKSNHEYLADILNTELDPLEPYTNMNWGSFMLSDLYSAYRNMGYIGYTLDWAVWSSYNKGITGYNKTGVAERYIERTIKEIRWMENILKDNG